MQRGCDVSPVARNKPLIARIQCDEIYCQGESRWRSPDDLWDEPRLWKLFKESRNYNAPRRKPGGVGVFFQLPGRADCLAIRDR